MPIRTPHQRGEPTTYDGDGNDAQKSGQVRPGGDLPVRIGSAGAGFVVCRSCFVAGFDLFELTLAFTPGSGEGCRFASQSPWCWRFSSCTALNLSRACLSMTTESKAFETSFLIIG